MELLYKALLCLVQTPPPHSGLADKFVLLGNYDLIIFAWRLEFESRIITKINYTQK